jgi:hypothetical protein
MLWIWRGEVEWNIAVRVRVRKGHVPRDVGGRGWVGG